MRVVLSYGNNFSCFIFFLEEILGDVGQTYGHLKQFSENRSLQMSNQETTTEIDAYWNLE